MILGVFRGLGRGYWAGVAERTLTNPHVNFEQPKTFHSFIFKMKYVFLKNRGSILLLFTYCTT